MAFESYENGVITSIDFAADDWHAHFRHDKRMEMVAGYTARQCNRALIMPNLDPPIRTANQALSYRYDILHVTGDQFDPRMALYLTKETTPEDIEDITRWDGKILAVKHYPANATTGSQFGISNLRDSQVLETIACMEEHDIVFCLHGETADPEVDVFDRERAFLPDFFFLRNKFPNLRMVLEHITTEEAVQAVRRMQVERYAGRTAATITPQHMLINRNHMLGSGINPHDYCKPIAKREKHRQAVLEAATSGEPWFFLGSDSAPHGKIDKESSCGCAGCFTGFHALELYAEAFDSVDKIEMLPGFAGVFGARFYKLPLPTREIRLVRREWQVPMELPFLEGNPLVPFYAGETLHWQLEELPAS